MPTDDNEDLRKIGRQYSQNHTSTLTGSKRWLPYKG